MTTQQSMYPVKPNNAQKKANQLKTEVNTQLMNSLVQKLENNPINDATTETLKNISVFHVGRNVNTSKYLYKVDTPEKGMSILLIEDTVGDYHVAFTVCLESEPRFDRRVGLYHVLNSALKGDIYSLKAMMGDFSIKPQGTMSVQTAVIKQFLNYLKTGVAKTDTREVKKQYKDSLNKAEKTLYDVITGVFAKDDSIEIDTQYIQFRAVFCNLLKKPYWYTTSYLASMTEDEKHYLNVLKNGGATAFYITCTHKETGAKKVYCSLTACSAKTPFCKQIGRIEALRKMAKAAIYEIDIASEEDPYLRVIETISTLNNLDNSFIQTN